MLAQVGEANSLLTKEATIAEHTTPKGCAQKKLHYPT